MRFYKLILLLKLEFRVLTYKKQPQSKREYNVACKQLTRVVNVIIFLKTNASVSSISGCVWC